jgi:hypothetical protein
MGEYKGDSETSLEDVREPANQTNVDAEKNAQPNELERQVSGPPYTIWGPGAKIWIVFLVSISALISPFGATTFFPALDILTDVLNITPTQLNISVTTYMVRRQQLINQTQTSEDIQTARSSNSTRLHRSHVRQ